MLRKCVEENVNNVLDQNEYDKRYKGLVERYESIKKGIEVINDKLLEKSVKHKRIVEFIKELE